MYSNWDIPILPTPDSPTFRPKVAFRLQALILVVSSSHSIKASLIVSSSPGLGLGFRWDGFRKQF